MRNEPALNEIYGEFARIEKAERETATTISLLALAQRMPPHKSLASPKMVQPAQQLEQAKTISELESISSQLSDESVPARESDEFKTNITGEKTKSPEAESPSLPRRDVVRPDDKTEFPL